MSARCSGEWVQLGQFDFRTSQGGCVGAPIKGGGCLVDGGRAGGPYNGTCETLLRTGWPQECGGSEGHAWKMAKAHMPAVIW